MAESSSNTITKSDLFAALDALADRYGSPDRFDNRSIDDSLDDALDEVSETFQQLLNQLSSLPDVMEVAQLSAFEQRIAARRLIVTARIAGSSGDGRTDRRRARDILDGSPGSARTRNRDARRAAAIANNPELGDALVDGAITPDSVDHLTRAADAATGDVPNQLIDAAGGLTPDQTADVVDRFLEDRVNVDDVEQRFQQQMQSRTVRRYRARGLAGIAIEGPDPLINAMWAQLSVDADSQYRAEGGRDTPPQDRAPLDHRRFDAINGSIGGSESADSAGSGRAAIVITINGNKLFDNNEPLTATQLGTGPIPLNLLSEYMETSPISVMIEGPDGEPLWLGRTRRRASNQQFIALAVRDRGCVLCRAAIDRCEAHHLMPWTAPGRGRTDIDQLALLCGLCHRDLHNRNRTLCRQRGPGASTLWATRPATVEETPKLPSARKLE